MDAQFSRRIKVVLDYSKEEAIRLGNSYISVEHLFLGILRDGEGLAFDVLVVLGVELNDLRMAIEKMFNAIVNKQHENAGKLVKMYENMEAASAAQKLELMDEKLAAWLLQNINSRQAGAILDAMKAEKASRLTKILKPKEPKKLMDE